MSRLTEKLPDGRMVLKREHYRPIISQEHGHFITGEAVDELCHLEDLRDQGRLLELPCAVGDMLYIPSKDFHRVEEYLVEKIEIDSEGFWVIISSGWVYDAAGDFGKKYFLTREEAEEALERMEDGNV